MPEAVRASIDPVTPVCPTCGQPATRALGPDEGWECRNEACPEFGQMLDEHEPPVGAPAPTPASDVQP
jgi:hypothetical protein